MLNRCLYAHLKIMITFQDFKQLAIDYQNRPNKTKSVSKFQIPNQQSSALQII